MRICAATSGLAPAPIDSHDQVNGDCDCDCGRNGLDDPGDVDADATWPEGKCNCNVSGNKRREDTQSSLPSGVAF